MKDDIILNPRAYSFQVGEQLHARSVHSIMCKASTKMQNKTTRHKGQQKERKTGQQAEKQGRQGLGKTDAPSNKGKQEVREAGRQAERQAGRQ